MKFLVYITLYDLAHDGFDSKTFIGPTIGLVMLTVIVVAARKRRAQRNVLAVIAAGGSIIVALVVAGAFLQYRDYRLDLADLNAGRANVVEGVVHDIRRARGTEIFSVGDVPLESRTGLGGYGMSLGVVDVREGSAVRVHYGRATGHRFRVLRWESR